jgi:putative MATE family efflux protein
MSQTVGTESAATTIPYEPIGDAGSYKALARQLLWLAAPVLVEHVLHIVVGLTDTYMANHLRTDAADATAAVGTISYFLWFLALTVSAIGTGATALIARAKGAKHRSLANSVCGQSITCAIIFGILTAAVIYLTAPALVKITGLQGKAQYFALSYLRMLCLAIPFSALMFVSNSCLRGAGDTLTPALAMTTMDIINVFFTYGLTVGAWGLPELGFEGIAAGTVIAYICGGLLQLTGLLAGRGGIRLHVHRMRPHVHTLKRLFRIGLPSGVEGLLVWVAQFAVIMMINGMDATNRVPTAHNNAVRIESLGYMTGFAVATAAATMVGQNLGAKRPRRAIRAAYVCYAAGGGIMTLAGIIFILFGGYLARWMSPDPEIARMTAQCLFITGFIQAGFAASIVFSGALRGAGDTMAVMMINLASTIFVRLLGVLVVAHVFHGTLAAIWVVLSLELLTRGVLIYWRFLHGGWRYIRV